MKIRISLILAIFSVVFLLSACIITSHDYNVEISCDDFNGNHHRSGEFELEVGDKIRVELCSNATAGFQWDYEMTTEDVLREEDHDFEEPEDNVAGSAGVEVWTFEAVKKGTTEVKLEYSQPWEGGSKAEWTYTIKAAVE